MTSDALLELPVGRWVTVDVPASSANLGPGFDCFGLALNWRDNYRVEVIDSGIAVAVTGAAGSQVPVGGQNLVVRSTQLGLAQLGFQAPGLRLTGEHTIPHGRGLGSSSAAIVAGLAAADGLVASEEDRLPGATSFEPGGWLELAERVEGHPDNVAAALFGGLVLAYRADSGAPRIARPAVHPDVGALALVADQPVSTEQARGLLPSTVPHAQAAANNARAALLVHALSTDPDLLYDATRDLLHQEYRAPAMPDATQLLEALRGEGIPAVMSGAGPTVLVLARTGEMETAVNLAGCCGVRAVRLTPDAGVRVCARGDTSAG